MKLLTTLFLVFCSVAAYAQSNSTIIYLNSKGLTYDSAKCIIADKNIKFAEKFKLIKSIESSSLPLLDDIYLKLLPEAKRQNDKTALMFIYSQISFQFIHFFNESDPCKLYLDSASLYIKKVKDVRTLAVYYYYMGMYYALPCKGNTTESHYYLYKALPYFEQMENKETVILTILYQIGSDYAFRGDFESLKTTIDKMEQVSHKSIKQNNFHDYLILNIKSLYYNLLYKDKGGGIYLDSVIDSYKNQIRIVKDNPYLFPNNNAIITTYVNLVLFELEKSDSINYNRLYSYIHTCDSLSSSQDKYDLGMIEYAKARFFYKTKQYNKAEKEALQGIVHMSEFNEGTYKNTLLNLYGTLALTYKAKHNYQQALKYQELSYQTELDMKSDKQLKIIKGLEDQYELDKKEKTIQVLVDENLVQKKMRWLYIIIIILLFAAVFLSVHWLRVRRKEAERQVDQLKHRVVKSKFIPHFTGNVLNSINYLITKNPELAQKYISDFADFSYGSLLYSDNLCQSIHDELDYCRLYLKLEKLRFEDELEYEILVDKDVDVQQPVPSMILQTFCENALKHGLRPKPGGGKITIRVYRETTGVALTVEDNGIGREKAKMEKTEGTREGLKIVGQQLEIFNRNQTKKAYLQIVDLFDEDGRSSGTRFELHIP